MATPLAAACSSCFAPAAPPVHKHGAVALRDRQPRGVWREGQAGDDIGAARVAIGGLGTEAVAASAGLVVQVHHAVRRRDRELGAAQGGVRTRGGRMRAGMGRHAQHVLSVAGGCVAHARVPRAARPALPHPLGSHARAAMF